MNDWRFIGPMIGATVGLFGWLAKHISNTAKHPCKDDIVFRDTCNERSKRIEDKVEDLKNDMNRGFTEVKVLIKNGGQ